MKKRVYCYANSCQGFGLTQKVALVMEVVFVVKSKDFHSLNVAEKQQSPKLISFRKRSMLFMTVDAIRNIYFYYMADWFRVLWLVNSRSLSSRTDL